MCVCVSSYTCMSHSSHKEICGVSSLLLPLLGFWMLNSGHQVCHRESLYPLIYRVGSTISFVSHFSSFIISFCVALLVVNSISHYVKICFYNLLFNSDFIKCCFPGRYTICVFICTIVRWGMLVAGSRLTSPDLCEEQIFFYSHDVYMCFYTSFFKKIILECKSWCPSMILRLTLIYYY